MTEDDYRPDLDGPDNIERFERIDADRAACPHYDGFDLGIIREKAPGVFVAVLTCSVCGETQETRETDTVEIKWLAPIHLPEYIPPGYVALHSAHTARPLSRDEITAIEYWTATMKRQAAEDATIETVGFIEAAGFPRLHENIEKANRGE